MVPNSYSPQVNTAGDPPDRFTGNALRFATEDEAQAYVLDLSMRWTAVRDTRVVPSDDAPTHRIRNHTLESIEKD